MCVEKIRKICVGAFIVVGLACIFVERANAPKEYTAVADGFNGDMKVTIVAKKNSRGEVRITDVKYNHEDTAAIADPAIDQLITKLKETQDISKVDTVAGATYSSEGFIEGCKACISQVED
ncbi:FMN-binding protein [Fusobacterium sp.]|uniref:FMN-binding protein n=1 Tax=Fusobacterium sp. TaxID=68766 RepID=UPI0025C582AE|nr:FMN-binding protein [Fusobacterium sp.]